MLKRIFGFKIDEVIRDWRKLHNVGLHNLYVFLEKHYLNNQIKVGEMGRTCSTTRRVVHIKF
jgi:hypothetical protein